ncbi:MAG: response regulator [Hyphomicrobiaceae bacterium]
MRKTDQSKDVYVLLVEDDRDDFFLSQDLLQRIERERYWVVWAGSYDRAKLELHERAFDVALVDYRIGEKTGLDFISEVGPLYPHCPMILLTGLQDPDIDFAAERAGAADYLVKDSLTEGLLDRSIRYARQSAQKRALLDGVLSNAATGMIGLDAAGTPIIWNAKALEALELDQIRSAELSPAMIVDALGRISRGHKGPAELTRPDGRSFEVRFSRMKDGGAVAVLHDITMRVQAEQHLRRAVEEAERANKAKSSFLATMSHELRTPLNGILGMTRVIEGTPLNEVQREGVDVIRTSGTTLLNIINDVLDLSKIEAGRMELEDLEVSISGLVDEVVRLLAPTAHEKGVEMSAFVDPLIADTMRGDPLRLRQVLTNLVGNAVKFTSTGSVQITVEQTGTAAEPRVCFSVIDTGIGIPEAKLNTLFVKFSQVDASTTREFGGTGLGLALCKELIGLMGGEISCSSLPDHGSTFRFHLALPSEHPALAQARRVNQQCPGARLLLASPSTGMVNTVSAYARAIGATITNVSSRDALRRATEGARFDAVLLDGSFGNGETLEKIRALTDSAVAAKRLFLIDGTPGQGRELGLAEEQILARPMIRSTFERVLKQLKDCGDGGATNAAPEPVETAGRLLRILMAEDNPANQRVATALLKAAGFRIEIANNGRAALERATAAKYDIILMDVQMPVMDGLTATRKLRDMEALRSIPIIGLTAGAMHEDRVKCLEAGMTDYMSKPIDWDKLLALLDRVEREIHGSAAKTGTVAA